MQFRIALLDFTETIYLNECVHRTMFFARRLFSFQVISPQRTHLVVTSPLSRGPISTKIVRSCGHCSLTVLSMFFWQLLPQQADLLFQSLDLMHDLFFRVVRHFCVRNEPKLL